MTKMISLFDLEISDKRVLIRQDLNVPIKDGYIEIKWYDSYTNLVYPLRLRPHQRFNLDNRIFLPGTVQQQGAL